MAVILSERHIAFSEFEHQASVIHRELSSRVNALPVRYRKFFMCRLMEPISKVYDSTIRANEINPKIGDGGERRKIILQDAVRTLLGLQAPLLSYFNIRGTEEGGMVAVTQMMNREFALLYGVLGLEVKPPMIMTLPSKKKLKAIRFLGGMSRLHRYTYQKIGHAPNLYTDTLCNRIAEYMDNALYHVLIGNAKIPESKGELERRLAHWQSAIDELNGMQRPLYALWNIMEYSENVMNEWASLLNDELTQLEGIKKSDKERYKDLPE